MHFQIALTSDHVTAYGWVSFSEPEITGRIKKKEKEEETETVVKHKSADMYVGRPNKPNINIYNINNNKMRKSILRVSRDSLLTRLTETMEYRPKRVTKVTVTEK